MAAAAAAAAAAPPPPSAAAAPLPHRGSSPYPSMNALRSALRHSRSPFSAFFSPPFHPLSPRRRCRPRPPTASLPSRASGASRARAKVKPASVLDTAPKDPWLASLSLPAVAVEEEEGPGAGASTGWAIGVDPDTSGALAVLAPDGSSQVYDNPYLHMVVAEYIRKRLDTRSIIQLVRGLGAPPGTPAYIEKSSPFPTDGKLGWWSTGFSYGLWIGILVASGFSVVPVASQTWKAYFGLTRSESPKDDSRQTASILFPDKALSLKRKKHHGRAEALLIAAYGKGLSLPSGRLNKP